MLTFEKAYEFTQTIGSHTSFEEKECLAYFTVLTELSKGERIVEIGLEYGRSSSIALQVAKDRGLFYVGIDPFLDNESAYDEWNKMRDRLDCSGALYRMHSHMFTPFDLSAVLIDGDHSYEGVTADCENFLPHVKQHGFALFHDYQRESLPEVTRAVDQYMFSEVDEYMINRQWMHVSTVGTLGIWRKR